MPAAVPDRFKLEMRVGRDGDIEEWLATDTSLDRPVLVRIVGPETAPGRRSEFVTSVSDTAKVSHPHLARVFAVAEVEGGAYSVSEWTGGSTAADRVEASHTMELPDFMPNASGLAGATCRPPCGGYRSRGNRPLRYLLFSCPRREAGRVRPSTSHRERGDVRALAAALETALTGSSARRTTPLGANRRFGRGPSIAYCVAVNPVSSMPPSWRRPSLQLPLHVNLLRSPKPHRGG